MHVTVRRYTGSGAFADELVRRRQDVESLISGVPGFVAYYLAKTGEGVMSITVCQDQAGTDESSRRAGAYVREHLASLAPNPPDITAGEVVISLAK